MTRVLVVDDEPQLIRALRIYLQARGYEVDTAADGTAALDLAAHKHPDIVVLDLGLPDLDGQDVITALRGWTAMPILVLSGRAGSADKVDALDAGADDYLTKPFSMDEFLARLRALGRRTAQPDGPLEIAFGDVVVDLHDRRVTRVGQDSEPIRLTPTEWALLDVLLRNPGRLVSQRKLLADVWGPEYHDETNYLRYYMNRLRKKLEPIPGRPRYLLTEPGMGYRFQP